HVYGRLARSAEVSYFLIAPRDIETSAATRPGDSGAVWHLVLPPDDKDKAGGPGTDDRESQGVCRPLAVQWGGQAVASGKDAQSFTFALATSLTTICHALDVELVSEHNTGALPYWGQMGHYSIAAFAVMALAKGKLKTFMN